MKFFCSHTVLTEVRIRQWKSGVVVLRLADGGLAID